MISLAEAKNYLKVDVNEDDNLINNLVKASHIYIKNACGNYKDSDLSELAQKLLVAHWYENREVVGKADKLAFSLDSIFTQMKYCPEETSETT